MQTSKYLLAVGVLAAVVLPLQVQGGPDTEEQAKLREALRRALEQPGAAKSQPVTPTPAQPSPPPVQEQPPVTQQQHEPQPQPQAAPVTPVAPPPVTPTPQTFEAVPAPDDAASLARAREALRQKMQELQATPAPAPAPAPAVAPESAKPSVAVAPAPAPKSEPKPTAQPTAVTKPAPKPAPVATSNYKPIDAPASPFSAGKQAKLAELLARYRADSITAQEYHAQRAAILAEP